MTSAGDCNQINVHHGQSIVSGRGFGKSKGLKDKRCVIQVIGGASEKRMNGDGDGDEEDGDIISDFIGHIDVWQLTWACFLILFQVPSAFHIFSFIYEVIMI